MVESVLFFAIMGWCGTRWPGWWLQFFPRPKPGGPGPGPDPDPPYKRAGSNPMPGIAAIIGGIAFGYAMHSMMPAEGLTTGGLAAFAGGRIFSDIAGRVTAGMR